VVALERRRRQRQSFEGRLGFGEGKMLRQARKKKKKKKKVPLYRFTMVKLSLNDPLS
jgi:hypothetical protein